jgi:hypothetical protein
MIVSFFSAGRQHEMPMFAKDLMDFHENPQFAMNFVSFGFVLFSISFCNDRISYLFPELV